MSELGHNSGMRWIALSVDARFHPIIGCGRTVKPADPSKDAWSRFEAWIDLICEASWKQREVTNKGRTILLERGELMAARGWLAQRWNWTEKQVRGFLEKLEAEFMVQPVQRDEKATDSKAGQQQGSTKVLDFVRQKGQQKQNLVKVLSICNYDLYQTAQELNKLLEGQRKINDEVLQPDQQKGQQRASKGPELYQDNKDNKKTSHTRETAGASGRRWQERDPFGLNPWQAQQHQDVRFNDDFRIEVHNGFEAELRSIIAPAKLDLREVLDEAAKYVGRASAPAELKIQVRSQVARLAREAKERAAVRAERAAPSLQSAGRTSPQYQRQQCVGSEDAALAVMRDIAAREARKAREASQC